MVIEVTGVNTWNKGAELMLVAIRDHFTRYYPDVQLAVDQHFGSYSDRARYGLWQKAEIHRFGRSKLALSLMPESFRRTCGIVTDRDVDAVLDASGFAFGDQHPARRTIDFARKVDAWRQQGKAVILLPQALGPFEAPPIREAFARIVDMANLVFARDEISLGHVQRATNNASHVRLAPDFTNLLKPAVQQDVHPDTVCVVPNQRMIEKTETADDAAAYVPLMASCISVVEEAGLKPILLLHGHHDAELIGAIYDQLGHPVPVVQEDDPMEIKRILGQSHLVIASRFHALVSALSQGVPCIATSWSHKYEMLFKDYECEAMILPVPGSEDQIRERVQAAIGPERPKLVARLEQCAERVVQQVHDMWRQVDQELGLVSA